MDDINERKRTRSEENLSHKLQEVYDVIPFGRVSQTVKRRRHQSDEADDCDNIDSVVSRQRNVQKPPEDCVDLLLSQPWVKSNDTWTGADGEDLSLYKGEVSSRTVTRRSRADLPSCTGAKRKMSLDDLPHPKKLRRRALKTTTVRTRTQGETNNLDNHLSQVWRKQCICKPGGVSSESSLYMKNRMKAYHRTNTPDEFNLFPTLQMTEEMKINLCRESSPNKRRKWIDIFDTEQMVPSPSSILPVCSVGESQPHMWDQASFWQNSYPIPIESEHQQDVASCFTSHVGDDMSTMAQFPTLHHSPLIAKVPNLQTIPEIEEANLSRSSSASSERCSQLTPPKHFEE